MGLINYRMIFDRLSNYEFETRPRLGDVGRIAKANENELYGKVLGSISVIIWDEKKQLDPRPVEEFKRALLTEPKQKLFYIIRDGKIIGTWNKSPYDQSVITDDNIADVSERVFDEAVTGIFNEEMVTVVLNELVEKEVNSTNSTKSANKN